MAPRAILFAWVLSLAPLLLERGGALDLGALPPDASPRAALVGWVWVALAGVPRAVVRRFETANWAATIFAALPVLTLAGALDARAGASASAAIATWVFTLLLLSLLSLAADLAARPLASRALHAGLWFSLVVGLPLLVAAMEWGARSAFARAPSWLAAAALASPLRGLFEAVDHAPAWDGRSLAPLALAAALCAMTLRRTASAT